MPCCRLLSRRTCWKTRSARARRIEISTEEALHAAAFIWGADDRMFRLHPHFLDRETAVSAEDGRACRGNTIARDEGAACPATMPSSCSPRTSRCPLSFLPRSELSAARAHLRRHLPRGAGKARPRPRRDRRLVLPGGTVRARRNCHESALTRLTYAGRLLIYCSRLPWKGRRYGWIGRKSRL